MSLAQTVDWFQRKNIRIAPRGRYEVLLLVGIGMFIVQAVVMMSFSSYEYTHYSDAFDFGLFYQAWYLIAHGIINPYSTIHNFYYWQNHFEIIMWILAPLYYIYPHGVTLLWLQDLGTSVANLSAYVWIVKSRQGSGSRRPFNDYQIAGVALVLLNADPWIYWSDSYDFHFQSIATAFMVLAAMAFYFKNYKWTWFWVVLTLTTGDLGGLYVFAIGAAYIYRSRKIHVRPLMLCAVGLVWLLFVHAIGGAKGSQVANLYGYLMGKGVASSAGLIPVIKGMAMHPVIVFEQLWRQRLDIYANIAPVGFLGVLTPLGATMSMVTLAINALAGTLWIAPSFQSIPVYPFIVFGTVAWLQRLEGRRIGVLLSVFLVVNTLGWGVVWIPQIPNHWIDVSSTAANAISQAQSKIPRSASVIVSQGIMGRFSDRKRVYAFFSNFSNFRSFNKSYYVVLSPYSGIEVAQSITTIEQISLLTQSHEFALIFHKNGIWVFHFAPQHVGTIQAKVPSVPQSIPAWTLSSTVGKSVLGGPTVDWGISSKPGRSGYLVDEDFWRLAPGSYHASLNYTSSEPVNFEVWNATGSRLLARQMLLPTRKRTIAVITFRVSSQFPNHIFWGWGPFEMKNILTTSFNQIEIRAWVPGTGEASVFSLGISKD